MSKNIFIYLIIIVVAIAAMFILFQFVDEPQDFDVENQMIGYIFSIEGNRILVVESLSEGVSEYTGEFEELQGEAVWFTITGETEITNVDGFNLEISDLGLNMGVEVYSTGAMALSYPAQAGADRVIVTGEVY